MHDTQHEEVYVCFFLSLRHLHVYSLISFFSFFHFLFLALDSVVYPAMKAFPKGTEVTMCYGARPNDLLFVYSGEGNVK
jgi:hypothetical protein